MTMEVPSEPNSAHLPSRSPSSAGHQSHTGWLPTPEETGPPTPSTAKVSSGMASPPPCVSPAPVAASQQMLAAYMQMMQFGLMPQTPLASLMYPATQQLLALQQQQLLFAHHHQQQQQQQQQQQSVQPSCAPSPLPLWAQSPAATPGQPLHPLHSAVLHAMHSHQQQQQQQCGSGPSLATPPPTYTPGPLNFPAAAAALAAAAGLQCPTPPPCPPFPSPDSNPPSSQQFLCPPACPPFPAAPDRADTAGPAASSSSSAAGGAATPAESSLGTPEQHHHLAHHQEDAHHTHHLHVPSGATTQAVPTVPVTPRHPAGPHHPCQTPPALGLMGAQQSPNAQPQPPPPMAPRPHCLDGEGMLVLKAGPQPSLLPSSALKPPRPHNHHLQQQQHNHAAQPSLQEEAARLARRLRAESWGSEAGQQQQGRGSNASASANLSHLISALQVFGGETADCDVTPVNRSQATPLEHHRKHSSFMDCSPSLSVPCSERTVLSSCTPPTHSHMSAASPPSGASGSPGPSDARSFLLVHPDEFRNPSTFLKLYGDPLCQANTNTGGHGGHGATGHGALPPWPGALSGGPSGSPGSVSGGSTVQGGQDGNWVCGVCHNANYPRRFRCNRCNADRDPASTEIVREYAVRVYQAHLRAGTFRTLQGNTRHSSGSFSLHSNAGSTGHHHDHHAHSGGHHHPHGSTKLRGPVVPPAGVPVFGPIQRGRGGSMGIYSNTNGGGLMR